MSQFASYSVTHRCEIAVPEDVYRAFGHTAEYRMFSHSVVPQGAASGCETYFHVVEWCEAPSKATLESFANSWHNRILDWQQRLRQMGD